MWSIICSKGANLTSIRSYLTILVSWWSANDMVHHYSDADLHIPVTSPMRNSDQAHFYWLLATSQKLNCQISSESLWCANWNIWCDNAIFIKQIIGIFELAHLAVTISTLDRKGFEFRVLNLLLLTIIWRFLVEKYLLYVVGCGEFCCPSNGPSVARGSIKLRLLFEVQIFA